MTQKGAVGFVLKTLQDRLRPHPGMQDIVDKWSSVGRDTCLDHFRELKAKVSNESGRVQPLKSQQSRPKHGSSQPTLVISPAKHLKILSLFPSL